MGYELHRWLVEELPAECSILERAVAAQLAIRADDGTRATWPTLAELARWTGASNEASVRDALKRLARRGWEFRVPIGQRKGRVVFAMPGHKLTFRIPDAPSTKESPLPGEESGLSAGGAGAPASSPPLEGTRESPLPTKESPLPTKESPLPTKESPLPTKESPLAPETKRPGDQEETRDLKAPSVAGRAVVVADFPTRLALPAADASGDEGVDSPVDEVEAFYAAAAVAQVHHSPAPVTDAPRPTTPEAAREARRERNGRATEELLARHTNARFERPTHDFVAGAGRFAACVVPVDGEPCAHGPNSRRHTRRGERP